MATILTLMLLVFSISGHAAERLVLGTATPGGSFSAFGAALKEAIAQADPGLQVELLQTRGSAENLPLLQAGKVDVALVEGTLLHEATSVAGVSSPPILSAAFPTPGMFVVRADTPFRTVGDLRGRPVVFGAAGSGFVVLARYVLDGLGLDQSRDFQAILLQAAREGPPKVLTGEAAALWGGGRGWPAFDAVAAGPSGARFIGLSEDEVARVRARHPFLRAMQVPQGAYPGLNEPLRTVGSWSWLLARADLPDALAHRFAKALQAAQPELLRRFAAAEAVPEQTLAALPAGALLHPGVIRFYREQGLLP